MQTRSEQLNNEKRFLKRVLASNFATFNRERELLKLFYPTPQPINRYHVE
jgi:hypothetical protein